MHYIQFRRKNAHTTVHASDRNLFERRIEIDLTYPELLVVFPGVEKSSPDVETHLSLEAYRVKFLIDLKLNRTQKHASSVCVRTAKMSNCQRSIHRTAFTKLQDPSIIAIRYRQPICWTRARDYFNRSPAQNVKSLHQVALLVDRSDRMIASLSRISSSTTALRRYLNCWTAAITKKHRAIYEHTYPTTLVFSDGSSIEIEYHEPRKIIVLPLNMQDLTEEEQKKRLEMRKPKTKLVITEDIEDSFDENRYLNFKK